MIIQVLILIAGFILLIKGADFFVEGASQIALRFGIPQIVIGLTIVAFGTSAPEAAISISAAIRGSDGIAIGNILGSNIMNILLILGVASVITTLKVQASTVKYEIPFVILVTVILVCMGAFWGKLTFVSGIVLWALFLLFFVYLIQLTKKGEMTEEIPQTSKELTVPLMLLYVAGGIAAIVFGSDLTVDSASAIAKALGMSDRVIGLTIVAFGTSLPELMTSIAAALKKNADIAIGNIVGSNIFNILFVLGTTALIRTIPYSGDFFLDGIIAIATAGLLLICVVRKHQLTRTGGIIMLLCYAAYFARLVFA